MTRAWLVLGALLVGGTAFAQAPGETPPTPPPAATPAQAPDPVMANRWGVGLGLGGMSVTSDDQPGVAAHFTVVQLAARYRAIRHLELELALGLGQANDSAVDRDAVTDVAFDVRLRLAPHSAWDGWLMAGLGGFVKAPAGANTQMKNQLEQGMMQLGIGVERRFDRFSLEAELRMLALSAPQAAPPSPSGQPPAAGGAGLLSLGGSFYF